MKLSLDEGYFLPNETRQITAITRMGIERVQDAAIRATLVGAYGSPAALKLVAVVEGALRRFTDSKWPADVLSQFLSNWRSMHGTALFVSGLVVRLQREARASDATARPLLFEAAAEIAEIIAEDTGIDDTPHNELFTRFANQLVGDDRWQLSRYSTTASRDFRNYIKLGRVRGPIEEAILITAASESWNSAEYSFFDPCVRKWMKEVLGYEQSTVEETVAYVSHHSGDVELGHFLHALKAWALFCEATGESADPQKVQAAFVSYFERLLIPFEELNSILEQS